MRKLLYLVIIAAGIYVAYTRSDEVKSGFENVVHIVWKHEGPPLAIRSPMPAFASADQAEKEAVRIYPDLGVADSKFNKAFVDLYNRYKKEKPGAVSDNSWPLAIADEVAQTLPYPGVTREDFMRSLLAAKNSTSLAMRETDAYSLAQLDQAINQARLERKPLGFIMVWDQFFGKVSDSRSESSLPAFVHFYQAFHNTLVLVFVHHENELDKVPGAVQKGFGGPDEGGFAPNMAVVDATAKEFIVEIPMGGGGSDGAKRDEVFSQGIEKIATWLDTHPSAETSTAKPTLGQDLRQHMHLDD